MTSESPPAESVSIIIPTLNEADNIEPLVSQIDATGVPVREILFVDGGSTDRTVETVRRAGAD